MTSVTFSTPQRRPLHWSGMGASGGLHGPMELSYYQHVPYNCGPNGLRQGGDLVDDGSVPLVLDGQDVPRFGMVTDIGGLAGAELT